MDIKDIFLNTIKEYNMIKAKDRILVGVSGGPDSICLLHLLWTMKKLLDIKLFVAHLDHMFRGEESLEDANFVKDICEKWDIPFFFKREDVPYYIQKTGLSPEDAARRARYNFYEEISKEISVDKIALGHNLNDHEETILMNILRGTGLEGLSGIEPVRGNFIRPLINTPRIKIENYLKNEGISYQIDRTNLETEYFRNRLRIELIPLIEEKYCPHLGKSLQRLSRIVREDLDFIQKETEKRWSLVAKVSKDKIMIDLKTYLSFSEAMKRRIIRKAIETLLGSTKDFEYRHTLLLIDFIENATTGSQINLPRNLFGEKTYESFILYQDMPQKTGKYCYKLKIPGKTHIPEIGMYVYGQIKDKNTVKSIPKDSLIAYLDYDKIDRTLIVRNRRKGDRFFPLGASGSKKLKDFFIDEKVPKLNRDKIPIVESSGEILWVGGMRIDNRFKVTSNTKKILVIILEQEDKKC